MADQSEVSTLTEATSISGRVTRGAQARRFDTFEAAFSFCRDHGKPVSVYVAGEPFRIFQSGRAEPRAEP